MSTEALIHTLTAAARQLEIAADQLNTWGDKEGAEACAAEAEDCREAIKNASCDRQIRDAEEELDDACHEAAQDMTGQDGEERCNRAARSLVAARDSKLRRMDPESYAERRALGELGN